MGALVNCRCYLVVLFGFHPSVFRSRRAAYQRIVGNLTLESMLKKVRFANRPNHLVTKKSIYIAIPGVRYRTWFRFRLFRGLRGNTPYRIALGAFDSSASKVSTNCLFVAAIKGSDSWAKNHNTTLNKLKKHLAGKTLSELTTKDAQLFRETLAEDYAQATVSGDIKRIKTAMRAAVKDRLIFISPFEHIIAGDQSNDSRKHFVSREVIAKVIDACPNAEWRLLVALARFGGLRNPSETLALKWEHIDWIERTIKVPGSKGKDLIRWRLIPIYEELIEPLRDAFDPEHEYCITLIRGSANSLRNRFERILKRAGFPNGWPRLWHNLRASRDSELSNHYPAHEVALLMGNSPKVSEKHYKMMLPEHFERLKHQSGTIVAQQVPEGSDSGRKGSQRIRENTEGKEKAHANARALVHPAGFETIDCFPRKTSKSGCGVFK